MRIAIAGFMHESNTFAAAPTTLDQFHIFRGDAVVNHYRPTFHEIAGYIKGADDYDFELHPLIGADAKEIDLHEVSGAGKDLIAFGGVFLPARTTLVGRRQHLDARDEPALRHVANFDANVGNRLGKVRRENQRRGGDGRLGRIAGRVR